MVRTIVAGLSSSFSLFAAAAVKKRDHPKAVAVTLAVGAKG